MPSILAIETSSERASVALLHHGDLISRDIEGVNMHSQTVLPMVQTLLHEAKVDLMHCDAIAYGCGPGSFTGVRTACGIAQGLGLGTGLPLVPVVTLLTMAQRCHEEYGVDDVLTLLDARMGEVYWAQYRHDDKGWQTVLEPTLSLPDAVQAVSTPVACGNALKAQGDAFLKRSFYTPARQDWVPHAAQLAVLGQTAFLAGETVSAAQARPLYLRNKVALTTKERQEKMTGQKRA